MDSQGSSPKKKKKQSFSFSQLLVPGTRGRCPTSHPLPTLSPQFPGLPQTFGCSRNYPHPHPMAISTKWGQGPQGSPTGCSSRGLGSGCVQWLQERLGGQGPGRSGRDRALAPGPPHPTSQLNTPPRPGLPGLLAWEWLALNFKLLSLGDLGRVSSPVPRPPHAPAPCRPLQPQGRRPPAACTPQDCGPYRCPPPQFGPPGADGFSK